MLGDGGYIELMFNILYDGSTTVNIGDSRGVAKAHWVDVAFKKVARLADERGTLHGVHSKKESPVLGRISLMLAVFALVVSACADGGSVPAQVASGSDDSTTTSVAAEATTTISPTTTDVPVTTTTASVDTASDEITALRAAFAASADVTSGRMEGSIEMTGLDPSQGFTEMVMPFGGSFDNASGDFSFYMDMSGIAAAAGDEMPAEFADLFGEMEVRQIGETSYVKFPFFSMFLGSETPWISMPADEGDPTGGFTMTSPGNPSEILGSFEDAGATVELVGSESVNGVNATHYRVVFDTETLLAEATPEELAELEAQGPIPIDELPMDVWISDDGLVVRFIMEIDGEGIATEPGESFGHMSMRYDMFELNSGIVIEPPPPAEVTDVEDLELSFDFDFDA
jgi:hypothetical protein